MRSFNRFMSLTAFSVLLPPCADAAARGGRGNRGSSAVYGGS
jgi:hypothetical protein